MQCISNLINKLYSTKADITPSNKRDIVYYLRKLEVQTDKVNKITNFCKTMEFTDSDFSYGQRDVISDILEILNDK